MLEFINGKSRWRSYKTAKTTLASFPGDVFYATEPVWCNGKIYVFSGNSHLNDNAAHSMLRIYNPATNSWSSIATGFSSLAWHSACVDGQYIYLYGSTHGGIHYRFNSADNSITHINTYSNAPTQGRSSYTRIDRKCYFLDCILNVPGSVASGFKSMRWLIYDIALGTWSRTAEFGASTGGPTARMHHACTAYNGKLYLHGGYEPLSGQFSDLWEYTPSSHTWRRLADSPLDMHTHDIECFGDNLYTSCAWSNNAQSNEIYVYSLKYNRWTLADGLSIPGWDLQSCSDGASTYVLGGSSGATSQTVFHGLSRIDILN